MDVSGEVLDPMGIPIVTSAGQQSQPRVAYGENEYLVVWGGDGDIYAIRLCLDGRALGTGEFPLCTNVASQFTPRIASNDAGYLVAWGDSRNYRDSSENDIITYMDIYGTRVLKGGAVMEPGGVVISRTANRQAYAAAAGSSGGGASSLGLTSAISSRLDSTFTARGSLATGRR